METIEAAGNGNQMRPLRLEDLPDGLVRLLRMLVGLGVGDTFIEQPGAA